MRGEQTGADRTRDRVAQLLRLGPMTVGELARALALSGNAVRFHLAELQRAGLVHHVGVERRGHAGKPPAVYELTAAGEALQSRAYAPALAACVSELVRQLPRRELRRFLCAVGTRLATGSSPLGAGFDDRVAAAVALLRALGGSAASSTEPEGITIRGGVCPLAVAVSAEPATCTIVEGAIADLTGGRVTQQCHHGSPPHCRFLVRPAVPAA